MTLNTVNKLGLLYAGQAELYCARRPICEASASLFIPYGSHRFMRVLHFVPLYKGLPIS
jgi:hypothetical protein